MNTPTPSPASLATITATLRTLYLYLAARHLDASATLARAGLALPPAVLAGAHVATLPEFLAAERLRGLLDILRGIIAYGPGPDPAAALESSAGYHARALTTAAPDMRDHHATQEQFHREAAALVRGALAPMAETSGDCCGARDADEHGCTRLASHDGPHVAHRRDGAPVAIWESESAEGSK